jgi:hypothetical protein
MCIVSGCVHIKNIPLFSFPKNEDKLKVTMDILKSFFSYVSKPKRIAIF